MGFFRKKAAGYKAAIQVEKHRARAVELRERDPALYAHILAQADGSEAEGAARRDPEAYVALFLAAWDAEEAPPGPSEPIVVDRDLDHWPTLDVEAAAAEVAEFFREGVAAVGKTQLYFPRWVVKRVATLTLMEQVFSIRPEVYAELVVILGVTDDEELNLFEELYREDSELDEQLDAFLIRNHLSQIVSVLAQVLSAEE